MTKIEFEASVYKTTLKETSKDDDGNCVVEEMDEVYNLDEIAKFIAKKLLMPGHRRSTSDAMYINNNTDLIYLMEFKNRNYRAIKGMKQELLLKVYDSISILGRTFFVEKTIEELSEKIVYFVVFNENKDKGSSEAPSCERIRNKMQMLAKTTNQDWASELHFNKLEGILFKSVHVVDAKVFSSQYKNQVYA